MRAPTSLRVAIPLSIPLALLAPAAGLAQGTFQETLAGSVVGGEFSAARQTSDGGHVLAGTTFQGVGSTDVLLVKLDAAGALEWTRTFGAAADNEYGHDVRQADDGGYVIAGRSYSLGPGWYDAYVIKTDASGALVWSKTLGGAQNDRANAIALTSDGGYVVAGETENFGAGGLDFYLFRLDAAGNLMWTRTWGGVGTEYAHSVQQTSDGGFIAAGYGGSFGSGFWDAFLVRTDGAGNVLWGRAFGGADDERVYSVVETADGGFAAAGYTSDLGTAGSWDVYVVKTDSSGGLLWSKAYGGASVDVGNAIFETPEGGLLVAGRTNSFGAVGGDAYAIRTDAAGNELWSRTYGSGASDVLYSIDGTSDGGFALSGSSGGDLYLVKTDSMGDSGCNQSDVATLTSNAATSVVSGGSSASGGIFGAAATLTTTPLLTTDLVCRSGCLGETQSYCVQSKFTSVAGCVPTLSVCDRTLATGQWETTHIPRSGTLADGTSLGIYIYTHGVGAGPSTFSATVPFGTLCLQNFQRSSPSCAPATLFTLAGQCSGGVMSVAAGCNAGALGLAVGEDVNVQLWYRDPTAETPGNASFSNAVFYTLQ